MVSNVLSIKNDKNTLVKFYIEVSIPTEWKTISRKDKLYELAPGDSIFIPFNIMPKVNLKGSTQFLFTAYIVSENNDPLGYAYFYSLIKKRTSWALTSDERKIYLKNGQNTAPFDVTLSNNSSDDQDIQMSFKPVSKNTVMFDSITGKTVEKPLTLRLKTQEDTTFHYTFMRQVEPRNYRLIDYESYNPYTIGEAGKYSILVNSTSALMGESNSFRAGQKFDFIKLSDRLEVNKYGRDVAPLIMDMNVYNILGENPMMNIHLSGQTTINESSTIVYNAQVNYTTNFFTTNPYKNAVFYVGYFQPKFNIQVGNISGGILGTYQNGQGIKAEYYISKTQRIAATYTSSPRVFSSNPRYSTFGLTHNFQSKAFQLNTQFGHSTNYQQHFQSNVLNINASTNLIKNHNFGIRAGVSQKDRQDSTKLQYGFMAAAYYSGKYLHQNMHSNVNAMYNSPTYGIFGSERLTVNVGNDYRLNNKWNIGLRNNFFSYPSSLLTTQANDYQLNSFLNINRVNSKAGNLSPFLFYNISRIQDFKVHSRGLGINVGKYNMAENYRYFANLRTGYNHAIDIKSKEYFFFQFSGFVQVRTFSFMTNYTLGNLSTNRSFFLTNSIRNPQYISLSLRHQYVFSREMFVMQNAGGFSYSTLSGKNLNFNPELYCYAKGGWRFRIFAEINFSVGSKNALTSNTYYRPDNEDPINPQMSKSIYLGAGLRKEFGIPIPNTRKNYGTTEFLAFYDLNGNGKKDRDEEVIENVVIRLNSWEVITNKDGGAKLSNIPVGTYSFTAFCIADLNGWFPRSDDSIQIYNSKQILVPFLRGVKVTGKVFMDKEKIGAGADKQIDLSRIKIAATNGHIYNTLTSSDGSFAIYLPVGKYTLTLDESVLGEKFQLLQNNFELTIDEHFDNLFIPFYMIEKKRKVKMTKFDSNGNKIDE